jgi:hypothetical protein
MLRACKLKGTWLANERVLINVVICIYEASLQTPQYLVVLALLLVLLVVSR